MDKMHTADVFIPAHYLLCIDRANTLLSHQQYLVRISYLNELLLSVMPCWPMTHACSYVSSRPPGGAVRRCCRTHVTLKTF